MTEDQLARRAAEGNTAAFATLVRQHQSQVRGFLRRMTRGDAALADDLAQETFLEAHRKISGWRGEGSFAGWLCAIAWSRYLMEARKRRLEPLDDAMEIAGDAQPEADSALRLDLESAMARLTPPERAALTLCFALGLTNEEAAMRLGLPLGTLKSHVARGREKLKTLLQAWQAAS